VRVALCKLAAYNVCTFPVLEARDISSFPLKSLKVAAVMAVYSWVEGGFTTVVILMEYVVLVVDTDCKTIVSTFEA
jgi:hypothetical protein